jgi:Rrf2 family protein
LGGRTDDYVSKPLSANDGSNGRSKEQPEDKPFTPRVMVNVASREMLALSRTAGYAILALSCLEEAADRWVLLKDIVGRVNVPGPYLAKIMHALAQAGVVRAKRGYRGGFMLAKPSDQVSIAEIVDAVEGASWLGGCMLGFTECSDDRACPAHALCKTERSKIRGFLEKLTLKDVADFELRHGAIPATAMLSGVASEPSSEGLGTRKRNPSKPRRQ